MGPVPYSEESVRDGPLPEEFVGEGFRHRGRVLHHRDKNTPLANLFVRMLQQLGIEEDRFGESTGAMGEI